MGETQPEPNRSCCGRTVRQSPREQPHACSPTCRAIDHQPVLFPGHDVHPVPEQKRFVRDNDSGAGESFVDGVGSGG